ncbi:MAG: hypothetical protein R2873_33455 [Caldilineaceae bacterium]
MQAATNRLSGSMADHRNKKVQELSKGMQQKAQLHHHTRPRPRSDRGERRAASLIR